jgi:hypothetical protein
MTATPSRSLSHADSRRAIDAHFAGRAVPQLESAMRAHTLACLSCRSYYDRHLLLARLDPAAPDIEARMARGLGLPTAGRSPVRRWAWLTAFAVPVASALILLTGAHRLRDHRGVATTDPGAFVARSAGALGTREPALWIYRVEADGRTRLAQDRIHVSDELAFAYSNPAGKPFLLVFGVDEHRHVYWFHPAWAPGQSPPRAVAAAPGPGPHELGEAIRQELDGQRLVVRALLSDQPIEVAEVEAEIRKATSWDAPLDVPPPRPTQMVSHTFQVLP